MEVMKMANGEIVYLYEGGIKLIELDVVETRPLQRSSGLSSREMALPPIRSMRQPEEPYHQQNTYAKVR
jgi:hypothetical protein